MKSNHRRSIPHHLSAELHSDDGQDPKQFFRKGKSTSESGRKALQLCRQVGDTLNVVLSGECGDEILQNLLVARVTPAPDSSQLLVLVAPAPGSPSFTTAQVMEALHAAAGRLRTAVAGAITRKRAPRLTFQFLPQAPEGGEA